MMEKQIIAGIILMVIGIIFLLNNKNMSKGTAKFYKVLYTEKNLKVMFKIAGAILIVGGLIIIFK